MGCYGLSNTKTKSNRSSTLGSTTLQIFGILCQRNSSSRCLVYTSWAGVACAITATDLTPSLLRACRSDAVDTGQQVTTNSSLADFSIQRNPCSCPASILAEMLELTWAMDEKALYHSPMTDLLHMEISYVPGQVLWISQRGYIDKLLKRFGMESCRPVATPQAVGKLPDPVADEEPGVNDPSIPYRELVGGLQYLVQGTRPDIGNAVRTLGKYLSKYTKEHFVMAKRMLRYLQGTRDYGIVWNKPATTDLHFTAYADADLGSEKDDRKSITGYVLQMNGCAYAYKSHKQSIAQDDTCSAEFIAAAECSVMIMWAHNLCEELNVRRRRPTLLVQDNQSTIKVIKSTKGNFKVKGVDLKYHEVKDRYERGDFDVVYCPTTDILADIFCEAAWSYTVLQAPLAFDCCTAACDGVQQCFVSKHRVKVLRISKWECQR